MYWIHTPLGWAITAPECHPKATVMALAVRTVYTYAHASQSFGEMGDVSAQDETPDRNENRKLTASLHDDTSTKHVGALDIAESCACERKCQAIGILPCCEKRATVNNRLVSVKHMPSHRRRAKTYYVRRKKFLSKNVRRRSNDDRKRILCHARFLMCICTAITTHYMMASNAAQTTPRGIVSLAEY